MSMGRRYVHMDTIRIIPMPARRTVSTARSGLWGAYSSVLDRGITAVGVVDGMAVLDIGAMGGTGAEAGVTAAAVMLEATLAGDSMAEAASTEAAGSTGVVDGGKRN
jgi:hypothetical protein